MYNLLIHYAYYAIFIAIFINFIVLFGIRIIYVIINKIEYKELIKILFLPFSYGYLRNQKENNLLHYIYQIFIYILLVNTILGSTIIFYTHFA